MKILETNFNHNVAWECPYKKSTVLVYGKQPVKLSEKTHWRSDQKLLNWNFKHKKRCAIAHSNDYVRTKLNELLCINDQSGISDNETLYQKLSAKVIILILLKGYVKTGVSI